MPESQASGKLAEARFFLSKLATTAGENPEFEFYLSALVTAVRSVPLVLQKDYRSAHGEHFDSWWKDARKTIGDEAFWLDGIVPARNVTQKEGGDVAPVIVQITADLDAHVVTLRPQAVLIKFKEDIVVPPGETAAIPIGQIISEARSKAEDDEPSVERDLLVAFVANEPPLMFDAFIERFDRYIDQLAVVVESAEERFEAG